MRLPRSPGEPDAVCFVCGAVANTGFAGVPMCHGPHGGEHIRETVRRLKRWLRGT